ncbi:GspH/FimT family pseudopilin [Vulcaniibacterium gelatinicum]|uniref:GspH/FimT family pseudopilin n=1 Tax=Vulcaniibacterium gelatinicum TaxID=2598725 RepID=UPI0011C92F61|nr:GspH/FimT family pseudopilin [Vulcaniibacterium gelatinicum]
MRTPFRHERGFTLVELMITLAVAAIILALAVPGFQAVINGNRLTAAANELLAALQTARIEAVRYHQRTVLCLSANAHTATPGCAPAGATGLDGWIAFVDRDRDRNYSAGTDTLLRVTRAPGGIRLLASPAVPAPGRVTFRPDGFAPDAAGTGLLTAAISVCLPTTRPAQNVRRVVIGAGSRMSIESQDGGGACIAPANPT